MSHRTYFIAARSPPGQVYCCLFLLRPWCLCTLEAFRKSCWARFGYVSGALEIMATPRAEREAKRGFCKIFRETEPARLEDVLGRL